MKTIYKYPLAVEDSQTIEMPKGAIILCAQIQNLKPYLWALVDTEQDDELRRLVTIGTGHEVYDSDLKYISTYQMMGGSLVFHVFEAQL